MWKKVTAVLLTSIMVVACRPSMSSLTLAPTPAVVPVRHTASLNGSNVGQIKELDHLVVDETDLVTALSFNEDITVLVVAYAKGFLRRWNVEDGALLACFDVMPLSVGATVFDKHAQLLATAAGSTPSAKEAGYATNLNGARIWSTETGKLQAEIKPRELTFFSHIALSPDGRWLVGVKGAGVESWDVADGRLKDLYAASDEESAIKRMDAIVFDASGEYTAIADENGTIDLERWQNGSPDIHKSYRLVPPQISFGTVVSHPLAIAFDPARHWLAVVRDEQLEVWNLQSNSRHLMTEIPVSPVADLAFDPSGELLAVGTQGGWQLWAVGAKKLEAQHEGIPVYALAFSADGRLFAWGDVNGIAHLWGVPE